MEQVTEELDDLVGKNLGDYEIIKAIRSSKVLYIDETQFKVNVKKI